MKYRFVGKGPMLLFGGHDHYTGKMITLIKPVIVFSKEGSISFSRCIGNPSFINLTNYEYTYVNADPNIAKFYEAFLAEEVVYDNVIEKPTEIMQ